MLVTSFDEFKSFLLYVLLLHSSVSGRTSSARIKVVWIYKGTGYKFVTNTDLRRV